MGSPYQSASLYVGDLHPTITESLLFEIFKAVGPVASIRVCRDTVTRRSLGYAYVNFHNGADAQRALDTLNYTPIRGKPCRIMWSQRDPSIRKSGQGNIFISKLDESIDNKALYDTFQTFGTILSCKVVTNEKGESKGYGFVHYETSEAADQAIEKVNGMLLNGKLVHVLPFKSRSQRHPETTPNQFTNIYVKHFPKKWSKEELAKEFSVFGEIQSVALQYDEDDKSRGFGFVNFVKHESAVKAINDLHGKRTLDGEEKPLYVQRAMRRNERDIFLKKLRDERAQKYQGINLYVKNLDDSVDDIKLREVFTPFGKITSCIVMKDDKTNSRGFGFVCFTTPEEASKAVTQMHSAMLAGKPLYVALAERREMRRAKLAAQYAARHAVRLANPNITGGQIYGPMFYAPQTQRQGVGIYPVMRRGPGWLSSGPRQAYGQPNIRNVVYPNNVSQRGGGGNNASSPSQNGNTGGQQQNQQQGSRGGMNNANTGNNPNTGGRGFKYTPNARNQQSSPTGGNVGMVSGRKMYENGNPALASGLMYATPQQQKQILGENLFPKIRSVEPTLAPKITGMLLESLDMNDILVLIDSPEALNEKIKEAIAVLKEHDERVASTTSPTGNGMNEEVKEVSEGS